MQSLSTDFILSDINGKTMVPVDVFAKTILYFKQHLEQRVRECLDSSFQLSPDDVQWVVTVPAIWDDKAKFFMRKAAEKVNILYDVEYISFYKYSEVFAIAETQSSM